MVGEDLCVQMRLLKPAAPVRGPALPMGDDQDGGPGFQPPDWVTTAESLRIPELRLPYLYNEGVGLINL